MQLKEAISRRGASPGNINVVKNKLVCPSGSIVKSRATSGASTIGEIDAVLTTDQRDRDRDILKTSGARLDPQCPLLLHHDPTLPIGKLVSVLEHTASKLSGRFSVADTALGRDAWTLLQLGCLRTSIGFDPDVYEALPEKQGRYLIESFEVLELSLVAVPSNPGAVVIALHEKRFCTPMVKSWAATLDAPEFDAPRAAHTLLLDADQLDLDTAKALRGVLDVQIAEEAALDALLDETLRDPEFA